MPGSIGGLRHRERLGLHRDRLRILGMVQVEMETSPVPLSGMANVLRLLAFGNLLLAVGLSAVSYFWTHLAIPQPYDGRTTPVVAAAYGFGSFGFLMAAVAFWSASSEVRYVRPDLTLPQEDLAAVRFSEVRPRLSATLARHRGDVRALPGFVRSLSRRAVRGSLSIGAVH